MPRDWASPQGGQTYAVQMIRIRSRTQQHRLGSLVINPGGPGGSGIDTAVYLSFGEKLGGLPTAVTDQFDIVGFDPRGVGRSDPIKCIANADQDESFAVDPDPVTQAAFDGIVALNQRIATGCGQKYGDQLPTFSTEQAARDIRYALRSMRRQPGFALAAIVIVALGASAATCVFGLLDVLVIRSLPVEHPERLVWLEKPASRVLRLR